MPNGKVLYSGVGQMWGPFGESVDQALFGLQQLFDPATATWEVVGLAPLGTRSGAFEAMLPLSPPYHSATVLSFGGTLGPPPGGYLATPLSTLTTVDRRGTVTNAPAGVRYGETFAVGTPEAGEVDSVLLVRSPSPQHVLDADQRALRLEFKVDGDDRLSAVAPPDGAVAPPGFYYLFVNRMTAKGPVPSVARIVHLGGESNPGEAPQPFPDDAPAPTGGSATADQDTSTAAAATRHEVYRRRSS